MKKVMFIILIALLTMAELFAWSTFSTPSTFSSSPAIAENGDRRGADNDGDGRRENTYVRGYYRKDGTYVRSHYRASPSF